MYDDDIIEDAHQAERADLEAIYDEEMECLPEIERVTFDQWLQDMNNYNDRIETEFSLMRDRY